MNGLKKMLSYISLRNKNINTLTKKEIRHEVCNMVKASQLRDNFKII